MDTNPDGYLSYLLRLWRETDHAPPLWRASLESAQTREQHYFATLEALVKFLYTQTLGVAAADAVDTGLPDTDLTQPSATLQAFLKHK